MGLRTLVKLSYVTELASAQLETFRVMKMP
jgi:hypothetical protein